VGGHSLGGVAATEFASKNPSLVDGVVLLASYPASVEYAAMNLPTLVIAGSNDLLVDPSFYGDVAL
jgi:predicted esterase